MMNADLKKMVIYYLVSGVILGAIIILTITLSRYEKSLLDTMDSFQLIRINTTKMRQSIADMDSIMRKLNAILPTDYFSRTHRELILLTLDDIKKTFVRSSVTVTNFEEKAGELYLPVSIKFTVDDYTLLVNRVGYLSSLIFPHFELKSMRIERTADGDGLISIIEGSIKMPVERITTVKK